MKKRDLESIAGNIEWYPNAKELVELTITGIQSVVPDSLIPEEIARIAESVFIAMVDADIRGLFSICDEHEWARLALIARHIREGRPEYERADTSCDCGEAPFHDERCSSLQR